MICLRVAGGLGNQLFQISQALKLADYDPSIIRIYTGDMHKYAQPRDYDIERLLDVKLQQADLVDSIVLQTRLPRLFRGSGMFVNDKNWLEYQSKSTRNHYVDGYFQYDQSWENLERSIGFLRERINPTFQSSAPRSSLVIHARGGDFLVNDEVKFDAFRFYENAIKSIPVNKFASRKLVCSDKSFAVEVANHLQTCGIFVDIFQESDEDWEESFKLLMNSSFLVGSKSTFAWWAAALGNVDCIFPTEFNNGRKKQLFLPGEIQ